MTERELKNLYYINREIAYQQQRLEELESAAQGGVAKVTGMPHVAANGSSVENHAILIAEQRALIDCLVKRSIIEYNRLTRYIASVRDCRMRMILSLRHIDGMSWTRIAMRIGGGNTADGVRKAHQRFLQNR